MSRYTVHLLAALLFLRALLLAVEEVAEMMADEVGYLPPVTIDMLPLTAGQRITCWQEWLAAQRSQARLGRPLERWETIERTDHDERGGR